MKVTFAHLGNLHIILRSVMNSLGNEVIEAPPITKKTLDLGAKYAPETACLPLKISLGNFIEALERGADTIITCGGCGPCRLGYYAEIQKKVLHELGYDFDFIVVEPSVGSCWQLLRQLTGKFHLWQIYQAFRLAERKMRALDTMERMACYLRPREITFGGVDDIKAAAFKNLNASRSFNNIDEVLKQFYKHAFDLKLDFNCQPLCLGVIGEIYVNLEPFANQQLLQRLGRMGIEVCQPFLLGDYVDVSLLKKWYAQKIRQSLQQFAKPYLAHFIGGHGLCNIGQVIDFKNKGFDGYIHVLPFTCMPETVVKNIMPKVSKDYNIPGLSLTFDEQTGIEGVVTRIEAFIDLLQYNRKQKLCG